VRNRCVTCSASSNSVGVLPGGATNGLVLCAVVLCLLVVVCVLRLGAVVCAGCYSYSRGYPRLQHK
jgi:hypothetical protein